MSQPTDQQRAAEGQQPHEPADAVELIFDGEPCSGSAEQTILELAEQRGVRIPTLCHDPRLSPAASCGVCMVEQRQGADDSYKVPACGSKLQQGVEIRSASTAIEQARRWALELLMSDHFADCVAPCTLACPARVDVPGYVKAVELGDFAEAMSLIRRTNPLPGVCGRVCPHRCEEACRRALHDEAVAINNLKRLATDGASKRPQPPTPKPDSGHRVAIVGAGPAGLTAAWFLRLEGHEVKLLDARAKPGGMLRYAIPEYRLSRDVLDADLEAIVGLGVSFEPNRRLGKDFTVDELLDEGFDAVFVALGAWKGRKLRIPNEEGVIGSLELLCQVNQHELRSLEGGVAVIGGGNSAIDAARAAVRLGAEPVRILYRRSREQMPAYEHEIVAAIEEGVELQCLVSPVAIELTEGAISGVRLQRMRLAEADASGRPRPVPVEDSEHSLSTSMVVAAIGEAPELPAVEKDDERGPINVVDADTLSTGRKAVFAGGDFVTGPSSAIEAVAAGRRAAASIDHFVREGRARHIEPQTELGSRREALGKVHGEDCPRGSSAARAAMPERPVQLRIKDFDEGELGYSPELGEQEAGRCLRCGCDAYDSCDLRILMAEYQVQQGRLGGEVHRYESGLLRPGLHLDMNKCIRCERCVRMCEEVVGPAALGFVLRGFDTRLYFALVGDSEAYARCDACLADDGAMCTDTCPTGALTVVP